MTKWAYTSVNFTNQRDLEEQVPSLGKREIIAIIYMPSGVSTVKKLFALGVG